MLTRVSPGPSSRLERGWNMPKEKNKEIPGGCNIEGDCTRQDKIGCAGCKFKNNKHA